MKNVYNYLFIKNYCTVNFSSIINCNKICKPFYTCNSLGA